MICTENGKINTIKTGLNKDFVLGDPLPPLNGQRPYFHAYNDAVGALDYCLVFFPQIFFMITVLRILKVQKNYEKIAQNYIFGFKLTQN